jgi:hypothetical protein
MYDELIMPDELEAVIVALCADYLRRAEIISSRRAPYNVIMEYRFLNYRIMNAAVEIAGSRDALFFIYDIGNNIGYSASDLYALSESVYKERKREVRDNIARRLSLI